MNLSERFESTQSYDAGPCDFPAAQLPMLPQPGWRLLRARGTSLAVPNRRFSRARYALHAAFQAVGLGAASRLLAPAYHCRTMLDPALALEAQVQLYPLDRQLQPCMEGLERLLGESGVPPRALLLTHFLGRPLPVETVQTVAQLAERHGAALIEDCSHLCMPALWQPGSGFESTGRVGRFGVASHYKFFPGMDGAELWAAHTSELPQACRAPSWRNELRGLWNSWPRRRTLPQPLKPSTGAVAHDALIPTARLSPAYVPAAEGLGELTSSRWLREHSDLDALAIARRAHYRSWLKLCPELIGARPLFGAEAAPLIPYAFPLLLDRAEPAFGLLKRQGFPIWRWDDLAASSCPVAQAYRLNLLLLPCHQSLDTEQFGWLSQTLRNALHAAAERS